MPAYVFLPALVLLIGLLILAALYAGFAAARAVGAATPPLGAAWGAVTGPAWAIAMSILTSLAGGLFHGDADGGSVFGLFLLLGAVLGAGGGVLAVSDAGRPPTVPSRPRALPTRADLCRRRRGFPQAGNRPRSLDCNGSRLRCQTGVRLMPV